MQLNNKSKQKQIQKRKSLKQQEDKSIKLNKKIMLNDLCSSEKAKIGQLMILIQKISRENTNLNTINQQLEKNNKFLNQRINILTIQNRISKETIQANQGDLTQKQLFIKQLTKKIKSFQEKINQNLKKQIIDIGIQVASSSTIDQKTQTAKIIPCRVKQKSHKNIQTLASQCDLPTTFSKSFCKIMKNKSLSRDDKDLIKTQQSEVVESKYATFENETHKIDLQTYKNDRQSRIYTENSLQEKSTLIRFRDYKEQKKKNLEERHHTQVQYQKQKQKVFQRQIQNKNCGKIKRQSKYMSMHSSIDQQLLNQLLKQKNFKAKCFVKPNDQKSEKIDTVIDFDFLKKLRSR